MCAIHPAREGKGVSLPFIDIIFTERQLLASRRTTFQHVIDLLTFNSCVSIDKFRKMGNLRKKRPIRSVSSPSVQTNPTAIHGLYRSWQSQLCAQAWNTAERGVRVGKAWYEKRWGNWWAWKSYGAECGVNSSIPPSLKPRPSGIEHGPLRNSHTSWVGWRDR